MKKFSIKTLKKSIKDFPNAFKKRIEILFFNVRPLIAFEIIFKSITSAGLIPLIWFFLDIAMRINGLKYITQDNLGKFLINPFTLVLFVLLILILAILCVMDISAAIFTFEISRQRKKTKFVDIVKYSFSNSIRILKPKNLCIIPLVLVLFPMLNLGTTSIITQNFSFPSSWIDYLTSNIWIMLSGAVIIAVIFFLLLRAIYTVHYFTLEKLTFWSSVKKSAKIIRGNYINNIVSILFVQAIVYLSNLLLNLSAQYLSTTALSIFGSKSIVSSVIIAILMISFFVIYIIVEAFLMPVSCWRISTLFYENKNLSKEKIINFKYKEPKKRTPKRKKFIFIIGIPSLFIIAFISIGIFGITNHTAKINTDSFGFTRTIAYKNFSVNSPSYSINGIKEAKNLGANGIYEDVYQTKDDLFIAYNFKGYVSGSGDISKVISDFTYDEIKNLNSSKISEGMNAAISGDANSFLEFLKNQGENISENLEPKDQQLTTIQKLIESAKNNSIDILLDVSHLPANENTINSIIDSIKENYSFENCKIICENYDTLSKYKKINQSITTIYRASLAIGSLEEFGNADGVAIDMYNTNSLQVNKFHTENKEVYIWDVRDKDKISSAIETKADNVVTNHVKDCAEIAQRRAVPEFLYEIYKIISE